MNKMNLLSLNQLWLLKHLKKKEKNMKKKFKTIILTRQEKLISIDKLLQDSRNEVLKCFKTNT